MITQGRFEAFTDGLDIFRLGRLGQIYIAISSFGVIQSNPVLENVHPQGSSH